MTPVRRGAPVALMTIVAVARPAQAHLMTTGLGPFYDGLTHLLVSPEYLLPMIALALLAGLHGPRFGRAVLFALLAAWLAGSVIGLLVAPHVTMPVVTAAVTIVVGGMVAAGRPLPLALVTGFAIVVGVLAGGLNGIELVTTGASPLAAAGGAAALFVLVSLVTGQVASVRAAWARIAVQVAGSWIAAIGLFMLGWAVRGH
ncbi:MAG TPA: HupE/UreJ family protein [Candidatus Binatia bacterium]|nr:HupE/UreJ family protein [Candidatus Binatia bacterium]